MGFFNRKEFDNIIYRAKRRPLLAIKIMVDLGNLFFLRVFQSVPCMRTADIHHAGRTRPAFLERLTNAAEPFDKRILLPPFTQNDYTHLAAICTERTDGAGDIEEYYFRHRWSQCIVAIWSDKQVAISALNEISEWIDIYKDHQKPEWEPYSSSERVANLAVLLAARPELMENADQAKLVSFFRNSLYWIDAHLEYYPGQRTNNHILNNARAIVIAGSILGHIDSVEKGIRLFVEMAKKMISTNGFLRERSTHYQVVIANWLMDTIWFAKACIERSAIIYEYLHQLEAIAINVSKATEKIVAGTLGLRSNIGDISPDVCPAVSLNRLRFLHNYRSDTVLNHGVDISDGWFFVCANSQSITGNIPYPEYPLKYPTHGHNDLGSFIWAIEDRIILSDAGRFRYTKDTVSQQQIVGQGHNCLLVDGFSPVAEPLNVNGGWNPGYYSSADIKVSQIGENTMVLKHTGYDRIPNITDHTRIITLGDNTMVVEDIISGYSHHDIELRWHFHPSAKVETENGKLVIQVADKRIVCISSLQDESGSVRLSGYSDSQQYGTAIPAVCVQYSNHLILPITIKTTFSF